MLICANGPIVTIVAVAMAGVDDEAFRRGCRTRWASQGDQNELALMVLEAIPRHVPCRCLRADDSLELRTALSPHALRVRVREAGTGPPGIRNTLRCLFEPLCSHE